MGAKLVKAPVSIPPVPIDHRMYADEASAYAEALIGTMHQEDVKSVVSSFQEMRTLIEKANEYGAKRANYAALEAATLAKIAKNGWGDSIGNPNSYRRIAAEWIARLPEDKYNAAIEAILQSGETLQTLWKSAKRNEYNRNFIRTRSAIKRDTLQTYKECGYVQLEELDYIDEMVEKYDGHPLSVSAIFSNRDYRDYLDAARAYRDSTRIELRRLGAVGVGFGVYLNPNDDAHQKEILEAIKIRRENLKACIRSLIVLVENYNDHEIDITKLLKDVLHESGVCAEVTYISPAAAIDCGAVNDIERKQYQ